MALQVSNTIPASVDLCYRIKSAFPTLLLLHLLLLNQFYFNFKTWKRYSKKKKKKNYFGGVVVVQVLF